MYKVMRLVQTLRDKGLQDVHLNANGTTITYESCAELKLKDVFLQSAETLNLTYFEFNEPMCYCENGIIKAEPSAIKYYIIGIPDLDIEFWACPTLNHDIMLINGDN